MNFNSKLIIIQNGFEGGKNTQRIPFVVPSACILLFRCVHCVRLTLSVSLKLTITEILWIFSETLLYFFPKIFFFLSASLREHLLGVLSKTILTSFLVL